MVTTNTPYIPSFLPFVGLPLSGVYMTPKIGWVVTYSYTGEKIHTGQAYVRAVGSWITFNGLSYNFHGCGFTAAEAAKAARQGRKLYKQHEMPRGYNT